MDGVSFVRELTIHRSRGRGSSLVVTPVAWVLPETSLSVTEGRRLGTRPGVPLVRLSETCPMSRPLRPLNMKDLSPGRETRPTRTQEVSRIKPGVLEEGVLSETIGCLTPLWGRILVILEPVSRSLESTSLRAVYPTVSLAPHPTVGVLSYPDSTGRIINGCHSGLCRLAGCLWSVLRSSSRLPGLRRSVVGKSIPSTPPGPTGSSP